jgi:hypothetical protein
MSNTTQITTPESRKLISLWITGNDKKDARQLVKDQGWISRDISFWLQVIAECKAAKA